MAIWYPESGITFSQYLQANSFVRDVTGQVKTSGKAIQAKVSDQTKQLVASNQELTRTFSSGFDAVNSTLEWGFNRVSYALEDINVSIESLHADFNYSMGLLLEEVHTHNKLLSSLLNKLDSIHKTLESPTLTQAREFYHIGCERLSRGLLDKALEAFTEAEKKNDTDFFTQYRIGKLYLYGIDEDDNVINFEKAKQHLLLAARYAKAEISVDPSFAKLAAEALLQSSIANYAQLGEKNILGNATKTNELLEESRQLTQQAINLYPQLSEALYHSAKYSALLLKPQDSMPNLENAIIADRNYAVKVDIDHAFDHVRPHVLKLLSKLKESKKIEGQNKIAQAEQLIHEVSIWHTDESVTLKLEFDKCKQELSKAQEHYKSDTYFAFLDAIALTDSIIISAPVLKSKRVDELKDTISKLTSEIKGVLPASGKHSKQVEPYIVQTNALISKAEAQLKQSSYESFMNVLSILDSAKQNATSAKKLANEEEQEESRLRQSRYEQEARQKRRNEASASWAKNSSIFLSIVGFLGGCVSCFQQGCNHHGDDWFYGLLGGAIVGAIFGAILGQLHD